MKVTSYAVARPSYYDRNAAGDTKRYNAIVGPHAQTTRWTFTVPAGKKAYIEVLSLRISQWTAVTTPGFADCGIELNTSGSPTSLLYQKLLTAIATLPFSLQTIPLQVSMYPADSVACFTSDTSVGGTVAYLPDARFTTFDI